MVIAFAGWLRGHQRVDSPDLLLCSLPAGTHLSGRFTLVVEVVETMELLVVVPRE